jgi:hypothetical protein
MASVFKPKFHQGGLSIRKIAGATGQNSKLFDFDRPAGHKVLAT